MRLHACFHHGTPLWCRALVIETKWRWTRRRRRFFGRAYHDTTWQGQWMCWLYVGYFLLAYHIYRMLCLRVWDTSQVCILACCRARSRCCTALSFIVNIGRRVLTPEAWLKRKHMQRQCIQRPVNKLKLNENSRLTDQSCSSYKLCDESCLSSWDQWSHCDYKSRLHTPQFTLVVVLRSTRPTKTEMSAVNRQTMYIWIWIE